MLVGGGARSGFWGQMIADVTGLTIDLAAGAEAGAALGAARLGMLAAGAGDEATVCAGRRRSANSRPTRRARRCTRRGSGAFARSMRRKRARAEHGCVRSV